MSYMTLMVPYTLYGIGIIWSPHMYNLMVPLYGTDSFQLKAKGTLIVLIQEFYDISFSSYISFLLLYYIYNLNYTYTH